MNKRPKITSPQTLAMNLQRLMENSVQLHTQGQVSHASGVAQTAVSLMLRPDARSRTKSGKTPSPKLAEVESVARAFGMEVWQLLIDPATLAEVVARALTSPVTLLLAPHHGSKGAPADAARLPPPPQLVTQKTSRPSSTRLGQ